MEENIVVTPGGESAPKMTGFKSVCLKLGLMMVIIFVSRGAENVLLSLALSSGLFAEMDGNTAYLIQTAVSFLFLYIIPMICAALLLKPKGMCAEVYKKPVYFSNAMGMFPAMYGLSFLVNLLTMLVSYLFRNTDLYKSFNTVNELRPDNLFCAVVLLVQLVVIAPLFEEFWFRGIVMQSLRPYGNGFAIFVSGLIFGLTHANFSQFFYASVLGICLGYIAVSTKSIITTTIMHAMFNGMSGIMLLLITFDDVGDYLLGISTEQTPGVVCYLVFCFLLIMLMIIGVLMAIAKLRKIKRYKVPKMWEVSTAKRWGVFLSRFTVIIALLLAADTFTFQFIPKALYKLLGGS
ncbi:MAG: type II CAAX endopeptidase family protein [Oscillospiraceae bacterium]|nr:type II CAAX endopeptidase family protein [Oscillospiraceae bacterium]